MENNQALPINLILTISPDETDQLERDEQTRSLRSLIEDQIDGAEAELPKPGETPAGTRGAATEVGELLVKILPESVKGLLGIVSAWTGRAAGRGAKIKVDGIELEIPAKMTPDEMEAMAIRLYALQNNNSQN